MINAQGERVVAPFYSRSAWILSKEGGAATIDGFGCAMKPIKPYQEGNSMDMCVIEKMP